MYARLMLRKAIEGFGLACQAKRLSPHTIADYSTTLKKLIQYLGDVSIESITRETVREFFAIQTVGNKTLLNYHTGLSSFFKWCLAEEIIEINPMAGVTRPKPEKRVIQPISKEHVQSILSTLNSSDSVYKARYKSMILLLLDTGLRVSELCSIELRSLDFKSNSINIIGKNNKERILYFSPTTSNALWKYSNTHNRRFLFVSRNGNPLDRNTVLHPLWRLCVNAGVPAYSPHDLRHTFAINFSRNYPNIYALQQMLGHSTLDMVKHYLMLSNSDIADAHRHALPVENWGL